MNKTDYKDMWVFIERDGDSVLPVSLELCSETRRLCDASGEKLVAVIVGSISDGELQRVLDCGVDKVIHVTGTGYDYFNNDAYTNLFTVLCRKYRPTAVMVGGTINGRDFAPRFAARLGTGCTSDATELVWDPKTTDIEFVEPAVGGKMMAVITVPVARRRSARSARARSSVCPAARVRTRSSRSTSTSRSRTSAPRFSISAPTISTRA